MDYRPLDFSGFDGREEELKKIIRYHRYPVMYYRTDLVIHTRRLVWMIETFADTIRAVYPDFDVEKARTYAAIHDDPEIITGDVQYGSKLQMSKEERQQVSDNEKEAIAVLQHRFPESINGFSYTGLLYEYEDLTPDNLEGTISKYFDKLDAFCEALHELHAGNSIFAEGFATDIGSPAEVYIPVFESFPTKWPLFAKLRETGHPIFSMPTSPDPDALVAAGSPHTAETITHPSKFVHYDIWKEVTITRGGEKGMAQLTTILESNTK